MSSEMSGFSIPHEEILEVASVMAMRSLAQDDVIPRLGRELTPTMAVPEVSPEDQQQRVLGRTALFLARLSAPTETTALKEYLEGMAGLSEESILQSMGELQEQLPIKIQGEEIQNALHSFAEQVIGAFGESPEMPSIEEELRTAQDIAKQHDTSLAEVYRSDALYQNLQRELQTPEELARDTQEGLESIDTENLVKLMPAMLQALMPNAKHDFSEGQAEQFIEALENNPPIKAFFEAMMENNKEVFRQFFAHEMIAIWGFSRYQEALNEHEHLRPKRDFSQVVMDVLYPKHA